MTDAVCFDTPELNVAARGAALAERVGSSIRRGDDVVCDFTGVRRMTPSFANSFLFPLLEEFGREVLRGKIHWKNVDPAVAQAVNAARERYDQGFRLSTQRAA